MIIYNCAVKHMRVHKSDNSHKIEIILKLLVSVDIRYYVVVYTTSVRYYITIHVSRLSGYLGQAKLCWLT